MTWVAIGTAVVGGVVSYASRPDEPASGGSGGQAQNEAARSVTSGGSSSKSYIDPRMEEMLYGAGGVIPNAKDWYSKNSSGLNEQMITGMNNQWNQLGASTQGFNQMQGLGMNLMGGGVAANPFTGAGGMAASNMQYVPAQQQGTGGTGGMGTSPFKMPDPFVAASMAVQPSAGGGGGEPAPVAAPQQNNGLLSYWELANQQGWSPGDTGGD